MSKTFEYFKKTGEIRGRDGEWDGDEGFEFEYEVEDEKLLEAVVDLVYEDYFMKTELADRCEYVFAVKKGIKKLINDYDNLDEYVEEYDDELKDYFEAEAKEYYEQTTAD